MSRGNNRAVALREFQETVAARREDFANALPAHIPAARFERVVLTAIQNNLQLLDVPKRELFNACVKAAQDGLLPDGREGALVCRPSKNGTTVTWQPMIAGIRKKVRNSGEIATWDVQAVYEGDAFEYELGDNPFIKHKPALKDRGELIAVYSVATLKSGEKSRDVMSVDDVNRIRDRSDAFKAFKAGRIKSTPWSTDYAEMAKKTLAKRHSKVLPMSTDLDDLLRRDDALYDYAGASDAAPAEAPARRGIASKLDALAGPDSDGDVIDEETGKILDGEVVEDAEPTDDGKGAKAKKEEKRAEPDNNGGGKLAEEAAKILDDLGYRPGGIDIDDPAQVIAFADGLDAYEDGKRRNEYPNGLSKVEIAAWQRGHDAAADAGRDGSEDEGGE